MANDSLMSAINVNSMETKNSVSGVTYGKSEMNKDAFLNLLVTQMKYQDPLNPTNDKEFLAQMAQFSALEQMQNMNLSTSKQQAYALIGKGITGTAYNSQTQKTQDINGIVDAVTVKGSNIYLSVGGKEILLDDVENVYDSTQSMIGNISGNLNATQALTLVGKYVQAIMIDSDGNPTGFVEGRVDTVKFDSSGNPVLTVGNEEIYAHEIISIGEKKLVIEEEVTVVGSDDVEVTGKISGVNLEKDMAYIIVDGNKYKIDKINYVSDGLRLVGKEITYGSKTGTVEGITIKGGKTYLQFDGKLVSFEDYKNPSK